MRILGPPRHSGIGTNFRELANSFRAHRSCEKDVGPTLGNTLEMDEVLMISREEIVNQMDSLASKNVLLG
jgi:hypothetical protein